MALYTGEDTNQYTLLIFPFSLSQLIFLLSMNFITGGVGDYVSKLRNSDSCYKNIVCFLKLIFSLIIFFQGIF